MLIAPPQVDRIWGIRGSYNNVLKAIFYLLKGDYRSGKLACYILCATDSL